jgi:hypothetical protein
VRITWRDNDVDRIWEGKIWKTHTHGARVRYDHIPDTKTEWSYMALPAVGVKYVSLMVTISNGPPLQDPSTAPCSSPEKYATTV